MSEDLKSYLDQRLTEMEQRLMANQKTVLNIDEVALLTGISKSRIYHLCGDGILPYYKPEGTKALRFKRTEVEQWMLSSKTVKMTKEEMKQNALHAFYEKQGMRKAVSNQNSINR